MKVKSNKSQPITLAILNAGESAKRKGMTINKPISIRK
jgi:hypothetical protein